MKGIAGAVMFFVRRAAEEIACRAAGRPAPPLGTDWVGYEALIRFVEEHSVLAAEGDVVEIGTFLGGGAYRLSRHLERAAPGKRLIVIDIFDPGADLTPNAGGFRMASLYDRFLRLRGVRSQWEAFSSVTKGRGNIVALKTDSRTAEIPSERLCFAFIDGNHDPEFVESDFHLVWRLLSPGGAVAFHDYSSDLPETRGRIDLIAERHRGEIALRRHDAVRDICYFVKG
jgi:hypothetical protein